MLHEPRGLAPYNAKKPPGSHRRERWEPGGLFCVVCSRLSPSQFIAHQPHPAQPPSQTPFLAGYVASPTALRHCYPSRFPATRRARRSAMPCPFALFPGDHPYRRPPPASEAAADLAPRLTHSHRGARGHDERLGGDRLAGRRPAELAEAGAGARLPGATAAAAALPPGLNGTRQQCPAHSPGTFRRVWGGVAVLRPGVADKPRGGSQGVRMARAMSTTVRAAPGTTGRPRHGWTGRV